MTIASTTNKASYNGNGSTDEFAVPFYFLANADLVVTHVSAAGVESTLAITTDYTVTGAGDPAGGTVTLLTAPATGEKVVIKRSPVMVQETDYVENAAFPALAHEQALDRLTMMAQDLAERIDRAVLVPISSTTSPEDLLDELSGDVSAAAASAATATTQASLATTAKVGAQTAQGLSEAARDAAIAAVGGVKVSANDTTSGPLETKLLPGANVSMATQNEGNNETRTITVTIPLNVSVAAKVAGQAMFGGA